MLNSEQDQVMHSLVHLIKTLTRGSGNPLKGFKQSSDFLSMCIKMILAPE